MTDIENYRKIVDEIYGKGTAKFSASDCSTNHVLNALNKQNGHDNFKDNFIKRLCRIKKIYSGNVDYLKKLIIQVNLISKKNNWEGAFAELSAFDYLNQDILRNKSYIQNPIKPDVTIDKSKTFALELGKHEANLDGFVEDCKLFFDIKCLKDNVDEILKGIYNKLEKHLGGPGLHISAEYESDISYDDFKNRMNDLYNELKDNVKPNEKTSFVRSTVVKGLSYRIIWGSGILMSERSYDPFRHASAFHKQIFNNADQFVKDISSIVVYVVFPWFNGIVTGVFNSNMQFYRSLSRRVFCQYKHDSTKFNTFNSKFVASHSIYEISRHISGIVFLEDNTILSKKSYDVNAKSYMYLNPNAINPIEQSLAWEFLNGLNNSDYDDFKNDNY